MRFHLSNPSAFPDVRGISEGKAKYWSSNHDKDVPTLIYNVDFIRLGVDANTSGIAMGTSTHSYAASSRLRRPNSG